MSRSWWLLCVGVGGALCASGCLRFGYDEVVKGDARDAAVRPRDDGGGTVGDAGRMDAGGSGVAMDAGPLDAGQQPDGQSDTPKDAMSGVPSDASGSARDAGVVDAAGLSAPCASGHQFAVVAGQIIGAPHSDFPVLVSLTASWLATVDNGGLVTNPLAADLRFTGDLGGGSVLPSEVEHYDPANGSLVAWVRIPSLTAATKFYLYSGDCANQLPQPSPTVWTHYSAVWHLQNNMDATGQGNDCVDVDPLISTAGRFADGRAVASNAGTLDCGSNQPVDDLFSAGGSLSLWIKPDTTGGGPAGRIVSKEDQAAMNVDGWALFLDTNPSGSLYFKYDSFDGRSGGWSTAADSVALGSWHWIVVQYSSASTSEVPDMFVDGKAVALRNSSTAPSGALLSDGATNFYIGNMGNVSRSYLGVMDELRVAKELHSAAWIQTEYNNQQDPSGFFTIK